MAKASSGGEFEHHIVGIRLRVTGDGDLNLGLESYDNVRNYTLVPLTMNPTTPIEPTRLCNFQSQRTRWTLNTTELNDNFKISRLIIFAKPVAIEYPG